MLTNLDTPRPPSERKRSAVARPSTLSVCLTNPIGYTGASYYDCALAGGLRQLGHDVHYVSPTPNLFPWSELSGVPVHPWFEGYSGSGGKLRKALAFARSIGRVSRGIEELAPDLVHYEFPLLPPLDCRLLQKLKRRGLPLVFTIHDVDLFYGGRAFRRAHEKMVALCDRLIVHTRFSRDRLFDRFPGLEASRKCHVIPHPHYGPTVDRGVSLEEARRRLEIPPEAPVFLFFGGMREEKGLDLLLRGFRRVFLEDPQALLLIAGSPPRTFDFDLESLRQDAIDLGIESRVRWDLRRIDHTEMIDYYSAASAVVLPYRRIDMSGVLLLAMTLGKPVVATDVGGFPEVVEHESNGLLIPSGDVDRMSDSLLKLAQSEELRKRLGREAAITAWERFSPRKIAESTEKVYREVLEG